MTESGALRIEMGWGVEPPLTELDNFVQVEVSDASGGPVAVPAGALSAQVTYGDATVTRSLRPGERPGELRAQLIPTRAGTYSFQVTGTVRGRRVNAGATCSPATFECVEKRSEAEFPVSDPSQAELAARIERESERMAADSDGGGEEIAFIALSLALLALATALWGRRRARRGDQGP